jgi:hypothetical protein
MPESIEDFASSYTFTLDACVKALRQVLPHLTDPADVELTEATLARYERLWKREGE